MMAKNKILVTGGAGFIGSNFIINSLKRFKTWYIVNLDKLTYAGNLNNLKAVQKNPRYRFVKGDISNGRLVDDLFKKEQFNYVINFAAQSHVDRSIINPNSFIYSNVYGTSVLLDSAKKYRTMKFIQISTDEVYGELLRGSSKESDSLKPNNPYSASKASADLICRSYYKTFGMPIIVVRISNNYGPFQFPEKLIPLMIINAVNGKPLPVYGVGENIRDWIYVDDSCDAIIRIIKSGKDGEIYNLGGNNPEKNINLIRKICRLLSNKIGISLKEFFSLIKFVNDRPAHDFRYCLDTSKIYNELGWEPTTGISDGLEKTVDWYLNNNDWVNKVQNKEYKKYYKMNYSKRL
jgi:dTDP-glucose 4,6-dehydratase